MYISTYARMYACTYARTYERTNVLILPNTYIKVNDTILCMYVCICLCECVCACVRVCVYVYVYAFYSYPNTVKHEPCFCRSLTLSLSRTGRSADDPDSCARAYMHFALLAGGLEM